MDKDQLGLKKFLDSRNKKKYRNQKHKSNLLRAKKIRNKILHIQNREYYSTVDRLRSFRGKFYKKKKFNGAAKIIDIDKEFGIEESKDIDYFLKKSSEFIDSSSEKLLFNLHKCPRIWPSGITLLCSLFQWMLLTSRQSSRPTIASTPSNNKKVNSYLSHCGFYDYVGRAKEDNVKEDYYKNEEIVKIKHEKSASEVIIEERENEIKNLLKQYSILKEEQIEYFDSVVLTELILNVTEHGISNIDKGWWMLCQYHKTHKIISICIADNGIGFRNHLFCGPQKKYISTIYSNHLKNDGNLIKLALQENISGASKASKRGGMFTLKTQRGAKRGHGLKTICDWCKSNEIPFSIVSQYGFLFLDQDGKEKKCGYKDKRVFAGTLFQLQVKAK